MADQHEQQTGQPVFRMQKMYIKDLSFESPHAPQVFQASQKHEPTIELDLKLKHEVVDEDNYEVSNDRHRQNGGQEQQRHRTHGR